MTDVVCFLLMTIIATAPALLIGLGARILLDTISRSNEPSVKDFILSGLWQGVALHYAVKSSAFGIPVALAIAAKLFVEFNVASDITRCATTIIGVVVGLLCTDFLSQHFDSTPDSDRRKRTTHASNTRINREKKRSRQVQFRPSVQGGSVETNHEPQQVFISDITSVDSNSELIGPRSSMTPLEREVATLRARASLADSERRRYKEERKWAISQGNLARASQMKWEVKRYTALMQSCHREADAKLLEGSNGLARQNVLDSRNAVPIVIKDKSSRSMRESSNGQFANTPIRPDTRPSRRPSTSKHVSREANG